jgi:hypothetical protein
MKDYNTCRPPLILKEYGRNVQNLAEFIKTVDDREKRTEYAKLLIELMKQVNPAVKETLENAQKLWDDLHIISRFELEVDGPYPKPEPEILNKKPNKVPFRESEIRFRHYGRNLELLIRKAAALEDQEEREAALIYIGKMMKSFHAIWNKENVEDSTVLHNIRVLSNHKLDFDIERIRQEGLFDSSVRERRPPKPNNGGAGDRGKNRRGNQGQGNMNRRRRN